MIPLNLTRAELVILVRLLDRAENEFSNHGCGDFNVTTECSLSDEGGRALARGIRKRMVDLNIASGDFAEEEGVMLQDWMLFMYFRKSITRSLNDDLCSRQGQG